MTTNRLREVDLERGMPTMRAALQQLSFELRRGRSLGCAAVKLIHGYGSSGTGGKIRGAVRRALCGRQGVAWVLPGESFGPFSAEARDAAQRWPALRQDRDWGRENDGVTVVVLR